MDTCTAKEKTQTRVQPCARIGSMDTCTATNEIKTLWTRVQRKLRNQSVDIYAASCRKLKRVDICTARSK